jgi:hypothetical protein
VVGHLASLDRTLDARTHSLFAQDADQVPTTLRNFRDLGDRLHLLNTPDAHLGDPEGAADVGPLLAGLGSLHGSALVGTQLALGFDAQGAGATQPGAGGDVGDSVAGLVNTNVAFVAEYHLVAFFRVRLEFKMKIIVKFLFLTSLVEKEVFFTFIFYFLFLKSLI